MFHYYITGTSNVVFLYCCNSLGLYIFSFSPYSLCISIRLCHGHICWAAIKRNVRLHLLFMLCEFMNNLCSIFSDRKLLLIPHQVKHKFVVTNTKHNDGRHARCRYLQGLPFGRPGRETIVSPLHLHRQHKMDTSRVSGAVDEILAQGILRTLWPSLFIHTYI